MLKSFTNFVIACLLLAGVTFSQTQWTKYSGNPVLDIGTGWESVSIYCDRVIYQVEKDTPYTMWYDGWNNSTYRIGRATSIDGITWWKDTLNPVIIPTLPWEGNSTLFAYVVFIADTYKVWYGAGIANTTGSIGFAYSMDGRTNWRKVYNPVLTKGTFGQWDALLVDGPCIIISENPNDYNMWFNGWNSSFVSQIGNATAINDTVWNKSYGMNPVLGLGGSGEWDHSIINGARIIFNDKSQLYEMWYSGSSSDYDHSKIGYATSQDGIIWTKYSQNPVLQTGNKNSWDDTGVIVGDVIFDETNQDYKMWYSGNDGSHFRIGYATAPKNPVSVDEISEELPNKFSLEQNYPNPFNPTTTIGFGIQEKVRVKIIVINSIGEEVAVILNEEIEPGFHQVEFNGANLTSGVYFYQLRAGSFVETKKMVLLK